MELEFPQAISHLDEWLAGYRHLIWGEHCVFAGVVHSTSGGWEADAERKNLRRGGGGGGD